MQKIILFINKSKKKSMVKTFLFTFKGKDHIEGEPYGFRPNLASIPITSAINENLRLLTWLMERRINLSQQIETMETSNPLSQLSSNDNYQQLSHLWVSNHHRIVDIEAQLLALRSQLTNTNALETNPCMEPPSSSYSSLESSQPHTEDV